jgi:hypothetical protein
MKLRALYTHMLNGDVPELELGGILIALRIKGEGEAEMRGFYEAMQAQTLRLTPPVAKPMPIVIPSYNGARKQANLTPLLAILLHKLGFPVVVHGVSEDPTRVLTETILTCWVSNPPCMPDRRRRSWMAISRSISLSKRFARRWKSSWICAGVWACVTARTRWRNWRRRLLKMPRCAFPACRTRNM